MLGARANTVIVGSGPNGLAAAITLARAGRTVLVLEAEPAIGGGCRTGELTLPGFRHDPCSAVHPLAAVSPFFQTLPLAAHGLEWVQPALALAHPFDDGTAAVLARSVEETAAALGPDADAYRRLLAPLVADFPNLVDTLLGPLRVPRHPLAVARFGLHAIRSGAGLARARFRGEHARALFAGMAAHALLPLEAPVSAAFGLVLAMFGHHAGWPLARGGSQAITEALAVELRALGGEMQTGVRVGSLAELDPSATVLFDVTPRQLQRIAGDALPERYTRQLRRYRYGPGLFKVDWALDGPVPWTAPSCRQAGTLHLGGTLAEIAEAERAVASGRHPERPFIIAAQPSLFDPARAPEGKHTFWAYCHVPNGSTVDMTARIEAQIERFAPGFRERILARATRDTAALERHNENQIGGDINGGLQDLRQLLARPVIRWDPYATPNPRLFLCSSSTPPGGGVHGMCGYHAAQSVLNRG